MVLNVAHRRTGVEPFCKMSNGISFRNIHGVDCNAVQKQPRPICITASTELNHFG